MQQEPLPGRNAFVHKGRVLAQYPRRTKHIPTAAGQGPPGAPPLQSRPGITPIVSALILC